MTGFFSSVYCMDSGPGTGQFNMDTDMRIMASFADGSFQRAFGSGSCLFRFYSWAPSAVSLGRNQDPSEIDAGKCHSDGVDVVVRPTGGRAVFHADELTYSFFTETTASNEVIYRMVHDVIGRALQRAGVVTDFCRTQPDFRKHYASGSSATCFTVSAKYELQADGRKIVGSAQRRRGDVLLQHGSMPLTGRHRQITRYLATGSPDLLLKITDDMERKTASLDEFTLAGYRELVPLCIEEAGSLSGQSPKLLQAAALDVLPFAHESIS